jgi:hypothetical protein
MSSSELGEHLKPFVFLDLLEADMRNLAGSMTVHPHFWHRDDHRVSPKVT